MQPTLRPMVDAARFPLAYLLAERVWQPGVTMAYAALVCSVVRDRRARGIPSVFG